MSYQVLARKWRPKSFLEMVGQEHVLKALINALDHNRLHHAYLFTGTRGVGKTTLARIMAKCLNCERGISSQPCGICSSCMEIDEGRFIDLIEIDAASNNGVDDVRDLIDNAQYLPARGKFKVYLIDEVHMLSKQAFNALLKTLEEPPPHVKFLLATTDPQKLLMTVLSRCLQFNLKNLSAERITQHLTHILTQERIPFEEPALWQLARAADGSMRDALSLTDQAIGFGNGTVIEKDVRLMLGSINQQYLLDLMQALTAHDAQQLLAVVGQLAEHNPDYSAALDELLHLLHRIAVMQALPDDTNTHDTDTAAIKKLASSLATEDVQLFYQMGLHGKRDLPLTPDPRSGFEMTLLRMLAFKPQGKLPLPPVKTETEATSPAKKSDPAASVPEKNSQPRAHKPIDQPYNAALAQLSGDHWHTVLASMNLNGVVYNTAAHSVLDQVNFATNPPCLHFTLDQQQSALFNLSHQERLSQALTRHFGSTVAARITVGTVQRETPAALQKRLAVEQRAHAQETFLTDPLVKTLVEHFDGKVLLDSIKPLQH